MLELFLLPPVQKGAIALLLASIVFPLTGVLVVERNLLPMRFMMMHGAILGAALALVFDIDSTLFAVAMNVFLVIVLSYISEHKPVDLGKNSAGIMVVSMGLAFLISSLSGTPAKDLMSILWGSLYTLGTLDFVLLTLMLLAALIVFFRYRLALTAFLFNPVLAASLGIRVRLFHYGINIALAIVIALGMKLLGALLLDALVLLPAIIAAKLCRSFSSLIGLSLLLGIVTASTGFFLSLLFNLPASAAISTVGAGLWILFMLYSLYKK